MPFSAIYVMLNTATEGQLQNTRRCHWWSLKTLFPKVHLPFARVVGSVWNCGDLYPGASSYARDRTCRKIVLKCPKTRTHISFYSCFWPCNHLTGLFDFWRKRHIFETSRNTHPATVSHPTTPEFWPIKIWSTHPSGTVFSEMVIIYSAKQCM